MLEQLKAHYKDALTTNREIYNRSDYEWFYTKNGQQLGILKSVLTKQEKQLLSIFLTPIQSRDHLMTAEQLAWYDFLIRGDIKQLKLISNPSPYYRFIQFHIKQTSINVNKEDFGEALKSLFLSEVIIIWENDFQGVVIEKKDEGYNEPVSLREIIDTLSSDFYVSIHFYIGQKYRCSEKLVHHYKAEKKLLMLAIKHMRTQHIFTIEDVLPLLLVKNSSSTIDLQQAAAFLADVKHDHELLQTIKVFFECNLNVSLAAKRLHIHRNSLQYRIEKFIERTGMDIKHFKGATATYLAIIFHELTKEETRQGD